MKKSLISTGLLGCCRLRFDSSGKARLSRAVSQSPSANLLPHFIRLAMTVIDLVSIKRRCRQTSMIRQYPHLGADRQGIPRQFAFGGCDPAMLLMNLRNV